MNSNRDWFVIGGWLCAGFQSIALLMNALGHEEWWLVGVAGVGVIASLRNAWIAREYVEE